MNVKFKQVDVFTTVPYRGNPVAVILDGTDFDTETMQRIANWTNLSETTFVVKPVSDEADYGVRIFSPQTELPFAGHPTVGTAHAVLEAGLATPRDGKLVQECAAGLIPLTVEENEDGRVITLRLPERGVTELDDAAQKDIEAILGFPLAAASKPRIINVGPRWIVAQLEDARSVSAIEPDLSKLKLLDARISSDGITVFGRHGSDAGADIEVRTFAPSVGPDEDPVCGSGNGAVAVFVRDAGLTDVIGASYRAAQGKRVGRDGKVFVNISPEGDVYIGGHAVTCIEGHITR